MNQSMDFHEAINEKQTKAEFVQLDGPTNRFNRKRKAWA